MGGSHTQRPRFFRLRAANARHIELAHRTPPVESTAAELYAAYAEQIAGAVDNVLHDKARRADLADCLRADAKRFAAHKAHYVERTVKGILNDDKIPTDQRQQMAQQAMRTFERWGETERNYAAHSTQMAEKWADFEDDGDRYLLQYRTAADERVREEHAVLHNTTLPINDPFWDTYYPPLGWNCRCTVVQVRKGKYQTSDSAQAIKNGENATIKQPSFRFNPGKTKTCFPETVSYYKHAGKNRDERRQTEKRCEIINKNSVAKQCDKTLKHETAQCFINGLEHNVSFRLGFNEVAQSMLKDQNNFWLKNEILPRIKEYIKNANYVGRKLSDASHNTRKETIRLKEATEHFYYFSTHLPNGESVCIQIGKYKPEKNNGEFYFYTITKNIPDGLESTTNATIENP